ncbi:unnamed protein product [Clonostachys solani]|uniref:FAD dependent oxidoreductase domain-containing protein n=1 Tax=Clonostachys solani TaxID=160281 RepID=A0A9N9Z1P9_9HYPO|nr:unnamed protein product [Clonostachys solani]
MRITIVDSLPDDVLMAVMSNNIVYRPDLGLRSLPAILDSVGRLGSNAIIPSTDSELDKFVGAPWRRSRVRYVVRISIIAPDPGQTAQQLPLTTTSWLDDDFAVFKVLASDQLSGFLCALAFLEKLSLDRLVALTSPSPQLSTLCKREVLMVGAGLVNLVTASRLMDKGWKLHIVDAGPKPSSDASWMSLGCSHGGDDARMFTLSEMDNYNDRTISATMNGVFNSDSADEEAWIAEYEALPPWLASRYNEDIFSLTRDSKTIWDDWQQWEPELFASCETRHDILRIYSDEEHLRGAIERQDGIGATIRVLSPEDVAEYEPALADAAGALDDSGNVRVVAGGIIVHGFTVNAHKFAAQLIHRMTAKGAVFEWNKCVVRILFDQASSTVQGLICEHEAARVDNYVLSPGAYGQSLLQGMRCEGQIHGVLGARIRLPNLEPRLEHSLKLARKAHVTEDANVTVATDDDGKPILIIGSGYGYRCRSV